MEAARCLDLTDETALGHLLVPSLDPEVGAQSGVGFLEVLAGFVSFSLRLLATMEIQVVLVAIPGLVGVRETGIERNRLDKLLHHDRTGGRRFTRDRRNLSKNVLFEQAICLRNQATLVQRTNNTVEYNAQGWILPTCLELCLIEKVRRGLFARNTFINGATNVTMKD